MLRERANKIMKEFKTYRIKKNHSRTLRMEMRPYVPGEDMSDIIVNSINDPKKDLGMIAGYSVDDPHMRYIGRKYFKENFEEVKG